MTPDTSPTPRQELEARMTALLLGEVPAEEAAALQQAIAQDTALAKLYERLKETIALVREAEHSTPTQTAAEAAPLTLSEDRRQKLLARFKTVAPKEFTRPPRRRSISLVELGVAAALVGLIGLASIPNFQRARSRAQRVQHEAAVRSSDAADLPNDELARKQLLTTDGEIGVRTVAPQSAHRQRSEALGPTSPTEAPAKPERTPTSVVLPPSTESVAGGSETSLFDDFGKQRKEVALVSSPPEAGGFQSSVTKPASLPESNPLVQRDNGLPREVEAQKKLVSGLPEFAERQAGVGPATGLPVATTAPVAPAPEPSGAKPPLALTWTDADRQRNGNALTADATVLGLQQNGAQTVNGDKERLDVLARRKSAEVAHNETRALGFDWYLGNQLQGHEGKPDAAPASATSANVPNEDKVPALSDLPVAGKLFRSKKEAAEPTLSTWSAAESGAVSVTNSFSDGFFVNQRIGGGRALTAGDTASYDRYTFYRLDPQLATPGETPLPSVDIAGKVEVPGAGGDVRNSGNIDKSGVWNFSTGNGTKAPDFKGSPVAVNPQGTFSPAETAANSRGSSGGSTIALPRAYPQAQSLGDAFFSIDPEARRAVTITDASTSDYISQLTEKKAPVQEPVPSPGHGRPQESAVNDAVTRQPEVITSREKMAETTGRSPVQSYAGAGENSKMPDAVGAAEKDHLYSGRRQKRVEERELNRATNSVQADLATPKPPAGAPIPQPEIQTCDNPFSTFSLNVSDVSFKLAAASLEKGVMPDAASIRSEEFINAFDYRDPEPPPGVPIAFAWDRSGYPFAQNRDLLRFSLKTAALGRQKGRPLNLVLLLDNSGSMERADRVRIIHEALRVLATQLQAKDTLSVVTFARTARLWVDGVPGSQAGQVADELSGLTPEGGTNLEEAMNLAYQTALRHYLANGINRVVLLTDGAANLGNVEPDALKKKVEDHRRQGIALDCFGIGWEGYNDDLLEVLSRNGDGRYGFLNTPEEAATEFAGQLAGALHVAAADVKVQVEFNPNRVTAYRQIGYAKHQLTKEQFRDNTVDAAEIGAAESGNALYAIAVNPAGAGPLATVRVRYKVPGTTEYHEREWPVPYTGSAVALDQSGPAIRLAATASAFSEWLASSPYAGEVTPDRLLGYLRGLPEMYGADARPKKLEWMLRQAKSLAGK